MCTQTSERDTRRVFKIEIKVQQGRVIRLLNLLIFSLCYKWSMVLNIYCFHEEYLYEFNAVDGVGDSHFDNEKRNCLINTRSLNTCLHTVF